MDLPPIPKVVIPSVPKVKLPAHASAMTIIGATVVFLMFAGWKLIAVLSARDWCDLAKGADKGHPMLDAGAMAGCIGLMAKQIGALGNLSYISVGVIGAIALFLVVVVIASGRLSLRVSSSGVETELGGAKIDPKLPDTPPA